MNNILENLKQSINKNDYNNEKICISFIGGPGYGKTTISKILCKKMHLFHCSNDYIARQLEENGIDISDYEERTKLVSDIAFPFQDFLFSNNISFVLDANLMLYLDVLKNRCQNYGYKLFIIELKTAKEKALERSLKRLENKNSDELSNSDEADFNLFLKQYAEYQKKDNSEYIFAKINSEKNIESQVDMIIKKIKEN